MTNKNTNINQNLDKSTDTSDNNLVIYQTKSGALEIKADSELDTIWASLDQISSIFEKDKSNISRHIKKIFAERELDENTCVAKNATVVSGDRVYMVNYYNLDLILSVGYRVNSKQATKFRQWATQTLRSHITKGYTINPDRIKANYNEFMKAVNNIKILLPKKESQINNSDILELISTFANTWLSLDAYDKDKLTDKGHTKKDIELTSKELNKTLLELKHSLIKKNEATELFGKEKQANSIEGIVGNIMQSFAGNDVYPTIEEKAANLLYFIIKNHPFVDGNKRSGAYAFIWFLRKANILNENKINPETLTTLTLFIAESNPKNKDKMIRLVLQLLG